MTASTGPNRSWVRIFHNNFGYGETRVANKLEIDFEHAGRKRVMDILRRGVRQLS